VAPGAGVRFPSIALYSQMYTEVSAEC